MVRPLLDDEIQRSPRFEPTSRIWSVSPSGEASTHFRAAAARGSTAGAGTDTTPRALSTRSIFGILPFFSGSSSAARLDGALGMCEGVFWTTATDIGGRNRGLVAAFMNAFGNAGSPVSPTLTPMLTHASLGWPGAIAVARAIVAGGGFVWCWTTPLPPATSTRGA